jgi:hypothetical protein
MATVDQVVLSPSTDGGSTWSAPALVSETPHSEGLALNNLGIALRNVRRFEGALSSHQDAAGIFRETSDRHSEDIALRNVDADRTAQAEDGGRE